MKDGTKRNLLTLGTISALAAALLISNGVANYQSRKTLENWAAQTKEIAQEAKTTPYTSLNSAEALREQMEYALNDSDFPRHALTPANINAAISNLDYVTREIRAERLKPKERNY